MRSPSDTRSNLPGRASAMFSATVSASNSEKCWKTMPIPSRRAAAGFGTVTRSPRHRSLPAGGLECAVDDLDERRLAGAVFAQQRVNLSGRQAQRHPVVRGEVAEALDDVERFEERLDGRSCRHVHRGTIVAASCARTSLARLRLEPTRHVRRLLLARTSRGRRTCRSLEPVVQRNCLQFRAVWEIRFENLAQL